MRDVDREEENFLLSTRVTLRNLHIAVGDQYELTSLILDEVYEAQMQGRQFDLFLRVEGMVHYRSATAGVVLPFSHQWPLFERPDEDQIYQILSDWCESFYMYFSAEDAHITSVRIDFIYEVGGGCSDKPYDRVVKWEGYLMRNVRTKDNNCFFACIRPHLPKHYLNKKELLRLRGEMGLAWGVPVPLRLVLLHYPGVAVIDAATHEIHGSDELCTLVLKDEHYYVFEDYYYKKQCQDCKVVYFRHHRCPVVYEEKCLFCGAFHPISIPCNVAKKSFYQHMVCGKPRKIAAPSGRDKKIETSIVFYDIETHVVDSVHTPYIVGCCIDENEEFYSFVGDKCMNEFLDFILNIPRRVYLDAFNGCRFDHYFLVAEISKRGFPIERFQMSGGVIIACEFKNIRCIDTSRHTIGSLRRNLKECGCIVQKGDFDHNKASRWEDMPQNLRDECVHYLKGDVFGLRELHRKLDQGIMDDYDVSIKDFVSTGHLTYTMWLKSLKPDVEVYYPTPDQEDAFRAAVFGGRCYKTKHYFESSQKQQFLNGEIDFDEIEDFLFDLDVVSLYPTAMANFPYPHGECVEMNGLVVARLNLDLTVTGKMSLASIVYVKFVPNKNLQHSILPRRDNGKLIWDLADGEGWYTSVDVENAVSCGYSIEIKRGYYWLSNGFIFKDYIETLFQEKKNAPKGSVKYLVKKLLMNGLYGKMIQRPRFDESKWVDKIAEFQLFKKQHFVTEFEYIGKKLFVGGIPREKQGKKITKPSFLGAFILAYSRRIMMEYMKRFNRYFDSSDEVLRVENDFYYTDTDSLHVHAKNVFVEMGSELGQMSNDIGEGKIVRAIYIAPKLYMLEYVTSKSRDLHYHFRGKGVPENSLNVEAFDEMKMGGTLNTQRDFRIGRIHSKRNSKQGHIKHFSLIHVSGEDTQRILNRTKWDGRKFDGNSSVPHQ